jgi:ATP-dependent RNA helicase DDX31/DBP7
LPESRQTILCSATIESGVQELAKQALINPVFLKAKEFETPKDDTEDNPETKKNDDDSIAIPQQLKQHYVLAPAKLRLVSLIGLLRQITIKNQQKIIIYISTGDSVDWHFSAITKIADSPDRDGKATTIEPNPITNATPLLTKIKNGYESPLVPSATFYKLHGNMLQSERQMTFQGFSALTDKSTILICTDVAARGLDLPNVTQVIQYDPPCDPRDYIHRIGRTARLGKEGQAFLFLLPSEADYIPYLEDIKCTLHEHPLAPLWKTLVPLKTSRSGSKNESEVAATDVHMLFERFVQSDQKVFSE